MKSWKFFFSFLPWAAQLAQTEEIMFQNVAYRPTVYKTGDQSHRACASALLNEAWKKS